MDWLLTRPTVTGLAITGGVLSVAAILLRKREGKAKLAAQVDMAGYIFMGISMLLFIAIGFRT